MASPPIGRGCNLRSTSPRTRTEGHETSGDSSPSQMSTVTRPKASYRLPKVVSRSTEPFWSEARPKRREETKRARPARPCRSGRYKYAGAAAASLGRMNTSNRHWSERAGEMARSSSSSSSRTVGSWWARCFPCYDGERGAFNGCNVPDDLLPSLGATAAQHQSAPSRLRKYLVWPYDPRYKYARSLAFLICSHARKVALLDRHA
jgi:hypothetical protein